MVLISWFFPIVPIVGPKPECGMPTFLPLSTKENIEMCIVRFKTLKNITASKPSPSLYPFVCPPGYITVNNSGDCKPQDIK